MPILPIMSEVDKYRKYNKPIVIIFKNAWYQLKQKSRELLAEKLYNNLKPGSSIIVSSLDTMLIEDLLKEKGFAQVKLHNKAWCSIFEKPIIDKSV